MNVVYVYEWGLGRKWSWPALNVIFREVHGGTQTSFGGTGFRVQFGTQDFWNMKPYVIQYCMSFMEKEKRELSVSGY
jgi:hypothetical protein